MKSSQNAPKVIAIALRAAVKDLRETGVPTGFASPGRANVERAVNAIDSVEAAATELEGMAGEGPSDGDFAVVRRIVSGMARNMAGNLEIAWMSPDTQRMRFVGIPDVIFEQCLIEALVAGSRGSTAGAFKEAAR